MIIYIDRVPTYRFKRWQKFVNMLWPRLIGINVVAGDGKPPEITPVYIPFMRIERGDGQAIVEMSMWTDNAWVIFLYKEFPFVYVSRGGGVELSTRRIDED